MPHPDPDIPPPGDLFCETCGSPIPAGRLSAQCPRCLLSLASGFGLPGESETADDLLDPLQVRHFGDYELIGEIARGGMGIVYRARQISLNREVAIKMILAGELAGKGALRMFQIEARAAATLHHPNIVPVYEIGERETQHYFTMRFVPGGKTIADWAKEHREDYRAVASAAAKAARAVAHAHMRSILHRDLKPSNILWDAEAGPQVTDFGLAKLLDDAGGPRTRTVHALGSPSYMAPEQMNGRTGEITTATDVYGLGAVLYEMLSGRPPFVAPSALETMRRAAEEAPAPIPGAPADLRTICLKCLAKDQNDRYPSATALAEDLERFTRGEPISAAPLALPQILWRWAKRQPRMAALLALCLLFLLAGISGVLWQWRKAESARAEQAAALEHLRWQQIDHWLNDGDAPRALAYLASLIRQNPARWQAAMYAMSIADQTPFAVMAGPEIHPPSKLAHAACLAPDGSWIAGAGEDRVARLWKTDTGAEFAQFPTPSPMAALATSDGPLALAVATEAGQIFVLPGLGRNQKAAPPAPPPDSFPPIDPHAAITLPRAQPVSALQLAFSADGSRLLARSANGAEVWNTHAPGDPPLELKLSSAPLGAELSADGARALLWGANEAALWEIADHREIFRAAEDRPIRRATLAAGGTRFAFLYHDQSVVVCDVSSGKRFGPMERPLIGFSQLALDAAGDRLTLAGTSNDLAVFDVGSGLPVSPTMRHHYGVLNLRASPDGTRVASYGRDDTVKLWDAQAGGAVMSPLFLGGVVRKSADVSLSRDGRMSLVRTAEGDAREALTVWRSTRREAPKSRSTAPGVLEAVQISPNHLWECLGLDGGGARVDDLETGRVLLEKPTTGPVYAHLFSPDARKYYAVTAAGWVYGWSLENGQPLWKPAHQPGAIRPAAISPDGSRIAAGHSDGHIRIYDTSTGEVVQTLDHPGEIKVLRFAPDRSGRFVTGSTDRLARIWDLQTGRKLQTFSGHADAIISAAWSPDSRLLATASFDHTVRVWDAATGRSVCPPLEHIEWLSHLEFSPDGKLLATACRDGSARLWNPWTGLPVSPPLPQKSTCETVHFTADGAVFLVRDHDGFRFWDTELAEPVTGFYSEPHISGLGFDDAAIRDMMMPDGRALLLGHSMTKADLWTIPQPREPAPAWFPDFLEMLAQEKENARGEIRHIGRDELDRLWMAFQNIPGSGVHASWAKRVLGGPGQ